MPVRRSADPISVQHVWDAIRSATYQRQVATFERIVKYLQRVNRCTPNQAELYLGQTCEDGFVSSVQKTVYKGAKLGSQMDSFRIQDFDTSKSDGKDWYCIECHLAGDVNPCLTCHRVFHAECSSRAKQKQNIFTKSKLNVDQKDDSDASLSFLSSDVDASFNLSSDSNVGENVTRLTGDLNGSDGINITENLNNNQNERTDIQMPRQSTPIVEEKPSQFQYNESWCSVCNFSQYDTDLGLEKEELNHLLSFILERIRSWLPDCILHTMAPDPQFEWITEAELNLRAKQLIFVHMDMNAMGEKLKKAEYAKLYQFQTDVITIQHNVAIFHGIESQEYGAAELMLSDCIHDLKELMNCVDCYKHSNEKITNHWFCLPCRNPHRLVWAKQKGYPYWPAKIIKEAEANYDVRFFGGKYERSMLPKTAVKPITVSQEELQIKKTPAFNKAYEQLLLHQRLLDNPAEVSTLVPTRVKRKYTPRLKRQASFVKLTKSKSLQEAVDVYEFHDSIGEGSGSGKALKRGKYSSLPKVFSKPNLSIKMKKKVAVKTTEPNRNKNVSSDVIHISDDDCPFKENNISVGYDSYNEQVTSSTEECFSAREAPDTMQKLEQPYSDAVEKMRRKLEQTKDKDDLIKVAIDCMQAETDRIVNENNDHAKKLFELHHTQLSETKKKQWCYNCEQDAIYHCCWNTAYCSNACQQQHWQAEHKKVCRRKR